MASTIQPGFGKCGKYEWHTKDFKIGTESRNMATKSKSLQKATQGDFQTPMRLSCEVACLLKSLEIAPSSILEPTCGLGNLLFAVTEQFPEAVAQGREINPAYVACAIERAVDMESIQIAQGDFFQTDWKTLIASLPSPVLLLGNPPWVTNTDQSKWDSANVPSKQNNNILSLSGIEAITGKSNFDISEWMLSHLIEIVATLNDKEAIIAMLCKTSVARKVIKAAWQQNIALSDTRLYRINALADFDAAVDACLFFTRVGQDRSFSASIFPSLIATEPEQTLTWISGEMIANKTFYDRWEGLQAQTKNAKNTRNMWRSGVKHDASAVMELRREGNLYRNGHGELWDLEDTYLYPLLKTSDVAGGRIEPARVVLVPQKNTKESTNTIAKLAPKTWEYLQKHAEQLNARGSSIYKNRPQFAIFGIGDYTFVPWKVAISGMYKKLHFEAIGTHQGKPILVDDATYFLPCASESEALQVARLLNSVIAKEFFESFIFWDAKRPITSELLGRLDIAKLASACGETLIASSKAAEDAKQQMSLFDV
jgi:hypothetical protein